MAVFWHARSTELIKRCSWSLVALVLGIALAVGFAAPAGSTTIREWKQRNLPEVATFNSALVKVAIALNDAGNHPDASEFVVTHKACNQFGYATGKLSHLPRIPNAQAQRNLREILYYSADMALACVAMFKSQKSLVAFASYAQETKSDENSLTPFLKHLYSELGLSGSAASSAPTSTTTPDLPGVAVCAPTTAPPIVRPSGIFFGCASGDISLTNITWLSWGATSASGTGILNINECQPDCAEGQVQTYAATVAVSDPGRTNGYLVFQQIEAGPTGLTDGPAESGTQPGEDWGAG